MHLSAFPYLDPGSGSFLLQLLAGALLGLGLAIRSNWARIKRFFGGKPARGDDDSADDAQP